MKLRDFINLYAGDGILMNLLSEDGEEFDTAPIDSTMASTNEIAKRWLNGEVVYFDFHDDELYVSVDTADVSASTKNRKSFTVTASRSLEFGEGWNPEDKEIWESIDWKARNYEEYPVDGDMIFRDVYLYTFDGTFSIRTHFQKFIRPNPIYPPYYRPVRDDALRKLLYPDYQDMVGPMYDGHDYNGTMVMDRYETQEMYDALSR